MQPQLLQVKFRFKYLFICSLSEILSVKQPKCSYAQKHKLLAFMCQCTSIRMCICDIDTIILHSLEKITLFFAKKILIV